jgi:hypothetical protein
MANNERRPNGAKPQYSIDDWRVILRVSPLDEDTVLSPGEARDFQNALHPDQKPSFVDPFSVIEHEGHYLVDFFVNHANGEAAIGECAMRALDAIDVMHLPAKIDRAGIAPQRSLRLGTSTLEAYWRLDDATLGLEDWISELQVGTGTMDSELAMLLFDES